MYVPKNKEELKEIIFEKKISLDKIDTSKITDMIGLFRGTNFKGLKGTVSNWNVSNVTNMDSMFQSSTFNQDISSWNVSNVRDVSFMFYNASFNQDISNWNVSNVTDMYGMFYNSKFNQDISKWDVSNVRSMKFMFFNSKFNKNISNWNVKNTKEFDIMFAYSNIAKVQMFKNQSVFPIDMYNGTSLETEWKAMLKLLKFISGE